MGYVGASVMVIGGLGLLISTGGNATGATGQDVREWGPR